MDVAYWARAGQIPHIAPLDKSSGEIRKLCRLLIEAELHGIGWPVAVLCVRLGLVHTKPVSPSGSAFIV